MDWVMGAGGGVRFDYSVDIFRGEGNEVGKNRGVYRGRDDVGTGKRGADILPLLGQVGYKCISCEGRMKGRSEDEEGREQGNLFPWVVSLRQRS